MTEPSPKRRKVFLQTMGEQLRELTTREQDSPGTLHVSPEARSRTSLITAHNDPSESLNPIATPESDALPGHGDLREGSSESAYGASRYLWHAHEVVRVTASAQPLDFEDLMAWSQSYFDNWHSSYPMLHAPTVIERFQQLTGDVPCDFAKLNPYQRSTVRSVLSISLVDRRQTQQQMAPVPSYLVFDSFNDAITSLQQALTDEASLEALQAITTAQLFLLSMLRYNAASRLQGLAIRMALRLGLHRCPGRYSRLSEQEAELRKRVFWSMYCIDRSICSRLGLPSSIYDCDIDTCYVGEEKHGHTSHITSGRWEHDEDTSLSILIFRSPRPTSRPHSSTFKARQTPRQYHIVTSLRCCRNTIPDQSNCGPGYLAYSMVERCRRVS